MKTAVSIALVVLASLFVFSTTPRKNAALQGAWELVEGKMITEGEVTVYPLTPQSRHLKIISDSHFATVWQDPDMETNEGFNGGTYTFENGIYTEQLVVFSFRNMIGNQAHFKIRVEGDRLYMDACDEAGNIAENGCFEIWKRAADPSI